jgi:hypothetical protein
MKETEAWLGLLDWDAEVVGAVGEASEKCSERSKTHVELANRSTLMVRGWVTLTSCH